MATAYIVAATPSSPQPKRIANLKSAKAEADARAKLDRVDVEVRTEATDKLSYTAQGAPTVTAPALADPVTEFAAVVAETDDELSAAAVAETLASEQAERDAEQAAVDEANAIAEAAADAEAAERDAESELSAAAVAETLASEQADEDELPELDADSKAAFAAAVAALTGEVDTGAAATAPAADADDEAPAAPAADTKEHRGQAACGCSVEKIIENGEHPKGCADAPKAAQAAKAVERDRPARPARTGGGTRREAQGDAVAPGWELLYDKPRQKAQVGRKDGKYALICTVHKHAHPLTRLVQERGLRQQKRSSWCPQCTD